MADKMRTSFPISITFSDGELPSSTKLNGLAKQARNGLSIFEYAVGDIWNQSGDSFFSTLADASLMIPNIGRFLGQSAKLNPRLPYLPAITSYNHIFAASVGQYTARLPYPPAAGTTYLWTGTSRETTPIANSIDLSDANEWYINTDTGDITCVSAFGFSDSLTYQPDPDYMYDISEDATFNVIPDPDTESSYNFRGLKVQYKNELDDSEGYYIYLPPRMPLSLRRVTQSPQDIVYSPANTANFQATTASATVKMWQSASVAADTSVNAAHYRYNLPKILTDNWTASGFIPYGFIHLWDPTGSKTIIEGLTFAAENAEVPKTWMFVASGANLSTWLGTLQGQTAYPTATLQSTSHDPAYYPNAGLRLITVGSDLSSVVSNLLAQFLNHAHEDPHAFIEQAVEIVEQDVEVLEQSVTDIESDITTIEQNITDIEQNITDIEQDITDIEQDVTDIESDITGLGSDVTGIESDVTGLESDLASLLAQFLGHTHDDLEEQIGQTGSHSALLGLNSFYSTPQWDGDDHGQYLHRYGSQVVDGVERDTYKNAMVGHLLLSEDVDISPDWFTKNNNSYKVMFNNRTDGSFIGYNVNKDTLELSVAWASTVDITNRDFGLANDKGSGGELYCNRYYSGAQNDVTYGYSGVSSDNWGRTKIQSILATEWFVGTTETGDGEVPLIPQNPEPEGEFSPPAFDIPVHINAQNYTTSRELWLYLKQCAIDTNVYAIYPFNLPFSKWALVNIYMTIRATNQNIPNSNVILEIIRTPILPAVGGVLANTGEVLSYGSISNISGGSYILTTEGWKSGSVYSTSTSSVVATIDNDFYNAINEYGLNNQYSKYWLKLMVYGTATPGAVLSIASTAFTYRINEY